MSSSSSLDSSQLPMPETNWTDYSDDRLKQSLSFARAVVNHQEVSPRSELLYSQFMNEIAAALFAKTENERAYRVGTVAAMEICIHKTYEHKPENFSWGLDVKSAILELREMQYLARYGDCTKIVVGSWRFDSFTTKTVGWERISEKNPWTDISKNLRAEEAEMVRSYDSSTCDLYPTYLSIMRACNSMGYNFELVRWSIHTYAKRNFTFHKEIEDLIAQGKFSALANVLFYDVKEVRRVFSKYKSQTNVERLVDVIETMITRWFNTFPDLQNPNTWLAKEVLVEAYQQAQQKKDGQPNASTSLVYP